jgi:hypothetical protein
MKALSLAAAGFALLTAAACVDMPPEPPRVTQTGIRLTAAQEVPPNASAGWGNGSITYDRISNQLTWSIAYDSLSAPLQSAHFHGPAATGVNAGVMIPINVSFSPLQGSAVLTEAQEADLMAGRLYVNLHTPTYPNGEIRGQVIPGTPVVANSAPPRPLAAAPAPTTTQTVVVPPASTAPGTSTTTTITQTTPGQPGTVTTVTPGPSGTTVTTTRPVQ